MIGILTFILIASGAVFFKDKGLGLLFLGTISAWYFFGMIESMVQVSGTIYSFLVLLLVVFKRTPKIFKSVELVEKLEAAVRKKYPAVCDKVNEFCTSAAYYNLQRVLMVLGADLIILADKIYITFLSDEISCLLGA